MSLFFGLTPSLMINVKCVGDPILHLLTMGSTSIWHSVLNVKAVAGTFNQEKALVRAFSVITNLRVVFDFNKAVNVS